jgi:tetratricopeptide (TPR) repeat protein
MMATNQRSRQKKLEQKRAKRKAAQKKKSQGGILTGLSSLSSMTGLHKAPIHECWISTSLFEEGMGHVLISRRLTNGDIAFGFFLLDLYCLGIKDCFLKIEPEFAYNDFKVQSERRFTIENIHQTCAVKLIEGAVDYAKNLGFKPYKDYKKDKLIIGDIDSSLCPTSYEYGKDGKPCYIAGPHDNRERQRSIMKQLDKVLGSDNFNFLVGDQLEEGVDHKNVRMSSLSITSEPIVDEYSKRITTEIKKEINILHHMLYSDPEKAIPILEDLIEKHPKVVQFWNFLGGAYKIVEDMENSRRIAYQLYQNEPNYLFGKINYADFCLDDGDLEKIPEIFNDKYDLQGIYPDRAEFHITEAMNFFYLMARYFMQKNDDKQAQTYVNMMEDIDPDYPATKAVKEAMKSKQSLVKSVMNGIFNKTD